MATNGKWFANRGQILQLSIQALSLFVAGKNAWPDLTTSKYLSPGALLFYALVGLVIWSFVWMVRSRERNSSGAVSSPPPNIKGAPNVLVRYEKSGVSNQLILTSDKRRPVVIRKIGPLISKEFYQSAYELILVPGTPPPLDSMAPVKCLVSGVRNPMTGSSSALQDILRCGSRDSTLDTVTIEYADSNGIELSQQFILNRNEDDTVSWIPSGPVSPKGQHHERVPRARDLEELRQKVSLGDGFSKEHEAAVQYAKELEHERALRKIVEIQASQSAAALRARKPLLACIGDSGPLQAQMGLLHAIRIGNQNPEVYNGAHGVHGRLEIRSDAHNPITTELAAISETTPDPPEMSVQIDGGRNRSFAYLVELPGRFFCPRVDRQSPTQFERGPELTDGAYELIATLLSRNADPCNQSMKIRIQDGRLIIVSTWTPLSA